MRHLVFREAGNVAWESTADPEPDISGALVRPLAVARCDLDPIMAGFGIFPGPFPVGHEVVGEVVRVGEAVRARSVGEIVIVPFQVSCGGCDRCRSARYAACRTHYAKAGSAFGFGADGGGHGGGVADVLLVPHADHMLIPAPAGIDLLTLAMLPDNSLDAYRAVGPQLARDPGADVLIVAGAAPSIGLYAAALAVSLGAGRVRYVDRDDARCVLAEKIGAEVTRLDGAWPRRLERAAITVESSGEPEGLDCTIRSTDDYGTCTTVAIHFAASTPVPLLAMYTRGITMNVSRADSRLHLETLVRLTAAGRFDPGCVAPDVVPFEDGAEAWLAPATKLVLSRG